MLLINSSRIDDNPSRSLRPRPRPHQVRVQRVARSTRPAHRCASSESRSDPLPRDIDYAFFDPNDQMSSVRKSSSHACGSSPQGLPFEAATRLMCTFGTSSTSTVRSGPNARSRMPSRRGLKRPRPSRHICCRTRASSGLLRSVVKTSSVVRRGASPVQVPPELIREQLARRPT